VTAPTPQQTEEAIEAMDSTEGEVHSHAAAGFEALAHGIISLVTELDRTHSVGDYLRSIRVICDGRSVTGQGVFRLEIEDKNSTTDVEELGRQIAEGLQTPSDHHGDRPLRMIQITVQLDDTNDAGPE